MRPMITCGLLWMALLLPIGAAALEIEAAKTLSHEAEEYFRRGQACASSRPDEAQEWYRKAASRYERILRECPEGQGGCHDNLGNIYFRMNDLGRAILNYRRGLHWLPDDAKLRQNLQAARERRRDAFNEPEKTRIAKTLFFWHNDFPRSWRCIIFLCSHLLFWLSAGLLFWRRPFWLKGVAAATLLLWLAMAASLAVTWHQEYRVRHGVVLAVEVTARKGDGVSYAQAFTAPLHAGSEFVLLQQRPGWMEVRLPDGQSCWLPESAVELINP